MNRYGDLAMRHWREWLPDRNGEIDEPERFFEELGQEMSHRIASLDLDLVPVEYETEADFIRVGHRNMARLCAEEIVLTENAARTRCGRR